jgi:hypothetical protein
MKTYSFNLKNSCFMSLVQLLFEIALHKRVMKMMHATTSGEHTNTIKPMNKATLSHAIKPRTFISLLMSSSVSKTTWQRTKSVSNLGWLL